MLATTPRLDDSARHFSVDTLLGASPMFISEDRQWRITVVTLSLRKNPGSFYRLTRYGYWVADVRTPGEIERFVPLASLHYIGMEQPWDNRTGMPDSPHEGG